MKLLHKIGFHKYKWEEIGSRPCIVRGLFADKLLDEVSEMGECKCGALKFREVIRDKHAEMQLAFDQFYLTEVERLRKSGSITIEKAIELLESKV